KRYDVSLRLILSPFLSQLRSSALNLSSLPLSSETRKRRNRPLGLLIAPSLPLLAFGALMAKIDAYGQRGYLPPASQPRADAIIVLGAGVNEQGRPSRSLSERTRHAVGLWKKGVAPHLVCTGGVGEYPPSEARVAADLAISLGVPASRVLLEDASTSTRENARFAANMCRARGWKRVVVVSHPYHLWRARRDFARQNLIVYTSPARGGQVDFSLLLRVKWTAREAVLYLRDTLRP
ncbi:MAG: hypothetical protein JWN98_2038, partial [Abditibacteriota bacterium]|nr:hypothetical protein [Abditibacteriota bacterium]